MGLPRDMPGREAVHLVGARARVLAVGRGVQRPLPRRHTTGSFLGRTGEGARQLVGAARRGCRAPIRSSFKKRSFGPAGAVPGTEARGGAGGRGYGSGGIIIAIWVSSPGG